MSLKKSVVKSVAWRVIATTTTAAVAMLLTGNLKVAASIGAVDTAIKLFIFFGFDQFWERFVNRNKPAVVWLTGLSGAGKTTIAKDVINKLNQPCMLLDGDEIRELFPKTGFDEAARKAHMKRVGQFAAFLESKGITPIVSLISPYAETRQEIREMCDKFIEVHISTPLETCEARDTKGLYKKARAGEIKQFTGIDDPYEAPTSPEISLDTVGKKVSDCSNTIIKRLKV